VSACFQAGALVFGGGHVVLPLLRDPVVGAGLVDDGVFLAGYGAAQAVPGPLFTVAAWIGAAAGGLAVAGAATVAIFLPGMLLALGFLRHADHALRRPGLARTVAGINAGVVGILGAALVDPVGREAAAAVWGLPLALAAWIALDLWSVPPWIVVAGCIAAGGLAV
jgi:chromate transporter